MDPAWRLHQIGYNRRARERLAAGSGSGGTRFWGWEIVIMFCEIVIALDGYAEAGGMPVPKSHRARRAIVRRHFPRLAETYDGLYTLSLTARYYNGYAMTKMMWRKAAQCHGMLSKAIPVQRAGASAASDVRRP